MTPLYIDLDTRAVYGSNTTASPAIVTAIQGQLVELSLAFMESLLPVALPADTTGRLVIKAPLDHDGGVVLTDTSWELVGSGSAARYEVSFVADSEELSPLLLGRDERVLPAQIEWTIPGTEQPLCSLPFGITFVSSYLRSDDGLPTASLYRAFAWLRDTLLAGANVGLTVNEEAKTLTLNAAGGSGEGGGTSDHGSLIGLNDDDHPQYLNQTRGDARYPLISHTHTKAQVGLDKAPNMTLAEIANSILTDAADLFAAKIHTHTKAQVGLDKAPNMTLGEIISAVNAQLPSGGGSGATGVDVTLFAELIPPGSAVTAGTYYAFTIPRHFSLRSAYLTVASDTEIGSMITGALTSEKADGTNSTSISLMNDKTVVEGVCAIVSGTSVFINSGRRIELLISSVSVPYSGSFNGLQLWIHGSWS